MRRRPRRRWIPRHDLGLPPAEYRPWLTSAWSKRRDSALDFEQIMGARLPDRRLLPMPMGRHALSNFVDAAGLRPGDEVLVAAYNYYAVVRVLLQKQLVPVFVDVEPETLCMDPEDLRAKIGPNSRLVLVTHMFGHVADLDAIDAIRREHGLLLFEDCAHAFGSKHGSTQVGQRGDGALFSFGIWKVVGTFGGGALALTDELAARHEPVEWAGSRLTAFVTTTSLAVTARIVAPGAYGWFAEPAIRFARWRADRGHPGLRKIIAPVKDDPEYRFDPDAGAPYRPFMTRMLQLQLARLDATVDARRAATAGLRARLAGLEGVGLLDADRHGRSNGGYMGIRVDDTEGLAAHLAEMGVGANPHEFFDCSRLEQFSEYATSCPNAADVSDHVIRVPSHAALEPGDLDYICAAIAEWVR